MKTTLFLIIFFLFGSEYAENKKTIVEFTNGSEGLYSNLARVMEWIYCAEQDQNLQLHINLNQNFYGFDGNAFPALFKPYYHDRISTNTVPDGIFLQTKEFPQTLQHRSPPGIIQVQKVGNLKETKDYLHNLTFKAYAADGIENLKEYKYIYAHNEHYSNPDMGIFRNRCHHIVNNYFQPVDELQEQIDKELKILNQPLSSSESPYKIGIHIRCIRHYSKCNLSPENFIAAVERDVDQIMLSKNPRKTKIYLATLLEPVVQRLSAKYNVVCQDMIRTSNLYNDWENLPNAQSFSAVHDAHIDVCCLADCDEIWGGVSNMFIFIGCMKPNLSIRMLPSLAHFDGC